MPKLRVERMHEDVLMPVLATHGSAGMDVHAFWTSPSDITWYGSYLHEGIPTTRYAWLHELGNVINHIVEKKGAVQESPTTVLDGSCEARMGYLTSEGKLMLTPGSRAIIPTGLRLEIPLGWEVQVRPRSGLALKHGVTVLNSPGTIDADYRGEIKVILHNTGKKTFEIAKGDRIAQLVMSPVFLVRLEEGFVDTDTERGEGGFGSTGV